MVGEPLSPYAVTKHVNELYANTFARAYGMETVGLRYFNVFGPRQDPDGPCAAVIPKWIRLLSQGRSCTIYGDGTSSRDFCCIANVVQANVLGATTHEQAAINRVYNIALGRGTTLLQLYAMLQRRLARHCPSIAEQPLLHDPVRPGDIPHSWADIEHAVTRPVPARPRNGLFVTANRGSRPNFTGSGVHRNPPDAITALGGFSFRP